MSEPRAFVEPDERLMRQVMGRFLTGVAVLTTGSGADLHGMTINSLTSISLKPPILMVSLNFGTRTGEALSAHGRFAISVLGAKQESIARQFAVRGGARFADDTFELSRSGLPVVPGALSQAECVVVDEQVMGDHRLYFGQVESCRDRDGLGLAFNAGRFGTFNDFGHDELPWYY